MSRETEAIFWQRRSNEGMVSHMKNLPDHGKAFWDMFPSDGDGGIVISEIDSSDVSAKQKNEAGIVTEPVEVSAA